MIPPKTWEQVGKHKVGRREGIADMGMGIGWIGNEERDGNGDGDGDRMRIRMRVGMKMGMG